MKTAPPLPFATQGGRERAGAFRLPSNPFNPAMSSAPLCAARSCALARRVLAFTLSRF
jgi:hypothetical protein